MSYFRYREDRLPIFIFVVYFFVDVAAFFLLPNWWTAFIWFLLGIGPKACISAWGHHHQHVHTFNQPWLNRVLEVIYGFQTGMITNVWFLHHVLGHHKHYLDQEHDESSWTRKDGSRMGCVEYSFTITVTAYKRALMVGLKFRKHLFAFSYMLVIQSLIFAMFLYINWVNAVFVFLLPACVSLYITAWHTYYHHSGLSTEDDYLASYNIMHKWYNILTGNLGFHTAHHIQGGLHWSKLPDYHKSFADKIPAELYVKPCWPFSWMGKENILEPGKSYTLKDKLLQDENYDSESSSLPAVD